METITEIIHIRQHTTTIIITTHIITPIMSLTMLRNLIWNLA